MHSLRRLREKVCAEIINQDNPSTGSSPPSSFSNSIKANNDTNTTPTNDYYQQDNFYRNQFKILSASPASENSEIFNRELASMLRSDLVVTCSDYELLLLREKYKINHAELLTYFSTTMDIYQEREKLSQYERRKNFVWIGNHTHTPNTDSLRMLIHEIWP